MLSSLVSRILGTVMSAVCHEWSPVSWSQLTLPESMSHGLNLEWPPDLMTLATVTRQHKRCEDKQYLDLGLVCWLHQSDWFIKCCCFFNFSVMTKPKSQVSRVPTVSLTLDNVQSELVDRLYLQVNEMLMHDACEECEVPAPGSTQRSVELVWREKLPPVSA